MDHATFVRTFEELEKLCRELGGLHAKGNDQDQILLVRDNGTTVGSWHASRIKRVIHYVQVRLDMKTEKIK